ncbi:MAG TPA: hypothetical protein VN329_13670, partial [Roseomonas sp.]|nr:hypothetical protein [Roseomonas sp.]
MKKQAHPAFADHEIGAAGAGHADDVAIQAPGGGGGGGGGGGHGGGGGGGGGPGGGGGGGHGGGGGGGSDRGDLYGDQYVFLRDLDPTDGDGNGEVVLDANGNPILVGTNGEPIYYVANADGDYEIPADDLIYAQTVELERANVARAPDKVMEKSLDAALVKIEAASEVTTDPAGRIVCDGTAIDSPLENLALYQYLMTSGGATGWSEVVANADATWPPALAALLDGGWDPSGLLGAAFSKESPISMDAVLYENTTIGVNGTSTVNGELVVDYFSFTAGGTESYDYDRTARYGDVWLQWYEDTDGDPSDLELVQDTVLNAVFGGQDWADQYIALAPDGLSFV